MTEYFDDSIRNAVTKGIDEVGGNYKKDIIDIDNKRLYKWSDDFFKEKGMGESKNKLINLYTSDSKMFYKVVW